MHGTPSSRPSASSLAGALLLTALLGVLAAGAFFRYQAAGRDLAAAQHKLEQRRAENVGLGRSAALVKNTRFRIKAESPGAILGIGAVYLDESGNPQSFQTASCRDSWLGERYAGGTLDLSVSARDCSWAGQVAFYVLQFQSSDPRYPRPITLVGSWSNPSHVSDNVVRLP